jgi:hypothetical protein
MGGWWQMRPLGTRYLAGIRNLPSRAIEEL